MCWRAGKQNGSARTWCFMTMGAMAVLEFSMKAGGFDFLADVFTRTPCFEKVREGSHDSLFHAMLICLSLAQIEIMQRMFPSVLNVFRLVSSFYFVDPEQQMLVSPTDCTLC